MNLEAKSLDYYSNYDRESIHHSHHYDSIASVIARAWYSSKTPYDALCIWGVGKTTFNEIQGIMPDLRQRPVPVVLFDLLAQRVIEASDSLRRNEINNVSSNVVDGTRGLSRLLAQEIDSVDSWDVNKIENIRNRLGLSPIPNMPANYDSGAGRSLVILSMLTAASGLISFNEFLRGIQGHEAEKELRRIFVQSVYRYYNRIAGQAIAYTALRLASFPPDLLVITDDIRVSEEAGFEIMLGPDFEVFLARKLQMRPELFHSWEWSERDHYHVCRATFLEFTGGLS